MAQVLKEEVRNRILEAAEKVFYKKRTYATRHKSSILNFPV